MFFYLSLDAHDGSSRNISELLKFPVANLSLIDQVKEIKRTKTIYLNESDYESLHSNLSVLKINMINPLEASIPVNFAYDESPLDKDTGLILAAVVLSGLYVLIIWELVHRTFAAIIASTMAIGNIDSNFHYLTAMTLILIYVGILAAMNERPPMALIISWIDVETLLLLFGMMILVAVLSETGVFDYLAVYAFKVVQC